MKYFNISKKICLLFLLFKAVYISKIKKERCIFLLQTPVHENLGDHSIAIAETELIKKVISDRVIIELPGGIIKRFPRIVRRIVKNEPVLIHGGGFIGTLWKEENEIFEKTVAMFSNNRIIIFPQTVTYDSNSTTLKKAVSLLSANKDIWICARERISFEFCKLHFSFAHILLIPDMAFYLYDIHSKGTEKNLLLCMRDDKEKIISQQEKEKIYKILKAKFPNEEIILTDTLHNQFISPTIRINSVTAKINEFSQARLVITDRLHGMIFALLSGTPCLVFNSNNCKIRGVYEWVRDCTGIVYADEHVDIEKLCGIKEHNFYIVEKLKEKYTPLIDLLKETYR